MISNTPPSATVTVTEKTTLTELNHQHVRLADVEHDGSAQRPVKGICRVINRVMSTAQLRRQAQRVAGAPLARRAVPGVKMGREET